MSVSHQHVKQAWKDKKRGNTAAHITGHVLSSEQYYVALFSNVLFILGQYCVLAKGKTIEEEKNFGFFLFMHTESNSCIVGLRQSTFATTTSCVAICILADAIRIIMWLRI